MENLVSVIVPVYGVEDLLESCLESLSAQTYSNIEIIAVDDGSPDRCGAILEEYARKEPRLVVVHQKNGGLSAARNAGLEIARGDWIAFADSDDLTMPNMIADLLHHALDAGADAASGAAYRMYDREKKELQRVPSFNQVCADRKELFEIFLTVGKQYCWVWNKIYRAEVWKELRFPVGRSYEDLYIMPAVLQRVDRFAFFDEPVYYYYIREGSISRNTEGELNLGKIDKALGDLFFAYEQWLEPIRRICPEQMVNYRMMVSDACILQMSRLEKAGLPAEHPIWKKIFEVYRTASADVSRFHFRYRLAYGLFRISPKLMLRTQLAYTDWKAKRSGRH